MVSFIRSNLALQTHLHMYLIVIGWIYVTLLIGVMEASSRTGIVWGGIATFVLYGLAPMAWLVYLTGSPARRRTIKASEVAGRQAQATSDEPDTGRKAPAAAQGERVASVRKEP